MKKKFSAHVQSLGASQTGKSQHALAHSWEELCKGRFFTQILHDNEGYNALIDRFAFFGLTDRLIPINLSDHNHIIGINLLKPYGDIGAQAARFITTLAEVSEE